MKILWIPHTGWHIPQRAHLFCHALAERHEVHATDWVADFTTLRDYLSRRYLRNFTYRRYRDGNVLVHGIPRVSPALFVRALRRFNTWIFASIVDRIIRRYEIDAVVGTFVVPPPRAPRLIFDLFDDNPAYWLEFAHNSAMAREIGDVESAWISASDQIVAVSSVLAEKVEKQHGPAAADRTTIIPNGVDLARYRSADGNPVRRNLGLQGRQVVGFISALGEFSGVMRYLDAIRILARPDVAHLIVGSGALFRAAKSQAQHYALSSVIFAGQVSPNQVADYYAALDVGVLPFDLADFTHSACPMKLVEYVACGKPVVSTPLEEVRRMGLPGVSFAGPDADSFAAGISRALLNSAPPIADLDRFDIRRVVQAYEHVLLGET